MIGRGEEIERLMVGFIDRPGGCGAGLGLRCLDRLSDYFVHCFFDLTADVRLLLGLGDKRLNVITNMAPDELNRLRTCVQKFACAVEYTSHMPQ